MNPTIDIPHLFPALNRQLISFLKSLSTDDWQRQTIASKWKIKDVVSHLLDGNYRQISLKRDGWSEAPEVSINSNEELVAYLNKLNNDWVHAAKRLSPAVLIELLENTNEEVYKIFKRLDPFAYSIYPVSWAGQRKSYNWFDIAREYTERWLHQQQVRDAMNNQEILTQELYYPVLDIFMHAWPVACANTKADEGTILKTVITGDGGGEWFLFRSGGKWELSKLAGNLIAAETEIDGDFAWKLFSKSLRKENNQKHYKITGNVELGERVLEMVSVMA